MAVATMGGGSYVAATGHRPKAEFGRHTLRRTDGSLRAGRNNEVDYGTELNLRMTEIQVQIRMAGQGSLSKPAQSPGRRPSGPSTNTQSPRAAP